MEERGKWSFSLYVSHIWENEWGTIIKPGTHEVPQYLLLADPLGGPWFFLCRKTSRHSFRQPPGQSLFIYENPWGKTMRNRVPVQMAIHIILVMEQREIRNNLVSVLPFDPINHCCPRSATWVKVWLQEDHGGECAHKNPTRSILWHTPRFKWAHAEGNQSLESDANAAHVWTWAPIWHGTHRAWEGHLGPHPQFSLAFKLSWSQHVVFYEATNDQMQINMLHRELVLPMWSLNV